MNAPRSDRQAPTLVRLYNLGLRLYPATFRKEYAEEMQTIFRLRLEDANRSGGIAVLGLACREALSLPAGVAAAHAQARKSLEFLSFILGLFNLLLERGSKMAIRRLFPKTAEQTPWSVAILSLIPFLLSGPLAPLLNYHPWWDADQVPWLATARLPVTVGLLSLGFLTGILKQFPRWSYLYSLYFVVLLPLGIISLINKFFFKINPDFQGYIFLLLAVLVIIASRSLPFLRPFFRNMRQDWTLLSYAFFAGTILLLATNDSDESPMYTLQVQLPSLIAWLGALAYLRLADPVKKIGALLGAVFLGVLIWWWPFFDGNSSSLVGLLTVSGLLISYWLGLGGLILAPMLIGVPSRQRSENVA